MTTDIVTLFRRLTLGVYTVGVTHGSEQDAFTGSAVMQASYNPSLQSSERGSHSSNALCRRIYPPVITGSYWAKGSTAHSLGPRACLCRTQTRTSSTIARHFTPGRFSDRRLCLGSPCASALPRHPQLHLWRLA
jgi:hypothetical protein